MNKVGKLLKIKSNGDVFWINANRITSKHGDTQNDVSLSKWSDCSTSELDI